MSDLPCKFLIYIERNKENKVSTVRMTQLKHINTYLKDVNFDIFIVSSYNEDEDEDNYTNQDEIIV
jgi:hypothetical protein